MPLLLPPTQGCFVPILSDEARRPASVLGEYLGDWKPPCKRDSPRELEVGRVLQQRPPRLDTAVALDGAKF